MPRAITAIDAKPYRYHTIRLVDEDIHVPEQ